MHLLFVCTGNVCRSAVAERWTSSASTRLLGDDAARVAVGSCGTGATTGRSMEVASADAVRALGGDPSGFSARLLTRELVESADLVLTMTRQHRYTVIATVPTAMRRTFTLAEAGGLLAEVGPVVLAGHELDHRAPELTRRLHAARRYRPSASADDIEDPMGRPARVHTATAGRIAQLLDPLTETLFCAARPIPPPADDSAHDVTPVDADQLTSSVQSVSAAASAAPPRGDGDRRERARPVRRGPRPSDRGRGRR